MRKMWVDNLLDAVQTYDIEKWSQCDTNGAAKLCDLGYLSRGEIHYFEFRV